jgi:gliding motility-associated-like protein
VPYQFSLDGGAYQGSGTFNGLTPSAHTITIRDANMCTTSVSATFTEPDAISLLASTEEATCPEAPNGSIKLTITGGTTPYNVLWSDGVTTVDRINVRDGNYTVIVTDKNGCAASLDVVVGVIGSQDCLEFQEIITPNNDGYFDTWVIKNIDLFPDAEVQVFNRWGKRVFRTKNPAANPWDATFEGKLLPTDSYHYIIYLNDGSTTRSGVVSIIR